MICFRRSGEGKSNKREPVEVTVGLKEGAQAVYDQSVLAYDPTGVGRADFDGNNSGLGINFQLVRLGEKWGNEVSEVIWHG